jgi:hypothetical protein
MINSLDSENQIGKKVAKRTKGQEMEVSIYNSYFKDNNVK